jgi:hypothetical protein
LVGRFFRVTVTCAALRPFSYVFSACFVLGGYLFTSIGSNPYDCRQERGGVTAGEVQGQDHF